LVTSLAISATIIYKLDVITRITHPQHRAPTACNRHFAVVLHLCGGTHFSACTEIFLRLICLENIFVQAEKYTNKAARVVQALSNILLLLYLQASVQVQHNCNVCNRKKILHCSCAGRVGNALLGNIRSRYHSRLMCSSSTTSHHPNTGSTLIMTIHTHSQQTHPFSQQATERTSKAITVQCS